MLYGYFAGAVFPETIPAGFLNLRRRPVDEFVHDIKAAGEIQPAVSVGDQDARFHRIDLRRNDPDRDLRIGIVLAENSVRDEGFLLHYPDRPVQGRRPLLVLNKNQYLLAPVVGILHKFKQPSIPVTGTDVMKDALDHSTRFQAEA